MRQSAIAKRGGSLGAMLGPLVFFLPPPPRKNFPPPPLSTVQISTKAFSVDPSNYWSISGTSSYKICKNKA